MRENERKNAKKQKGSFSERMCRALDIEPDILPGGSLVEIRGRGAVTVSGSGKILDYTDTEIRVALKKGAIAIRGKRLVCAAFCAGKVRIEGRIESVNFEDFNVRNGNIEKNGGVKCTDR